MPGRPLSGNSTSKVRQLLQYLNDLDGRSITDILSLSRQIQELRDTLVFAAYGGIRLVTPTALPDIGAGWTTLLFDTAALTVPKNVVQDFANNGLSFNSVGVYSVNVSFTLTHDENNASREIEARIYNVTSAIAGITTVIGISRNQPATNYAVQSLFEIPADHVGDLFVVEVGNGDTLLTVQEINASFTVNAVSEYTG